MKILKIISRQILDSNSTPTIEVDVFLDNDIFARASVPSGASTGSHEAVELRDENAKYFDGKSVIKAVENINQKIAPILIGLDPNDQRKVDQKLIDLDGTQSKNKLGANAILGVSIAICKAAALAQNIPTYQYIGQLTNNNAFSMPKPLVLLLEGGKHGNWSTDIQEYMITPTKNRFDNFSSILSASHKIHTTLGKILNRKKYSMGIGFEGGFCPQEISSNEEAFELIVEAIQIAGFKPKIDFSIAIDAAASEFFENGKYILKSKENIGFSPSQWTNKVISWTEKFPMISLEDIHHEDLWEDWANLTKKLGNTHQIVGDDLTTTSVVRIKKAADQKCLNAVLIKPNQIGTVSETIDAVLETRKAGFNAVVSHRGGETNDDFLADFCVGTNSSQAKFGGLHRGERLAKYNQLLRIEELISKF